MAATAQVIREPVLLTIYGILEQNLTPSRNATTQKVDRLNPTFLYGVSIPIWSARDSGHAL